MPRFLLFLLAFAALPAGERTLLLSLDGLGYRILSADPVARELKSLHALGQRGTFRPLRPAFPSKTSPGHAAIFTGTWAGANGIFSNTNPQIPRRDHRLADTVTGFRSTTLEAAPVWTQAARQGRSAVAYQATQAYPFTPLSAGLGLSRPPVVVNGYQTRLLAPHRAVHPADLLSAGPGRWRWQDGPLEFTVESRGRQALRISAGRRSVTVRATGGFSPMLPLEVDGIRTGAWFRLFERGPNDFLLYRTSVHELGVSGGDALALWREAGAFIANTPTSLYRAGGLGRPVYQGGDGAAERRYLECFALVTEQMTRQMLWLDRRYRPELFVGYYPQADDLEHVFLGLSRTGHPEVDETRRRAYARLDAGLRRLLARFDRTVVVSDHGMAPATHALHTGVLLKELGWGPERVRPNASCVFLNTADWRDGVIPLAEAPAEREKLAAALATHPLVTRVYRHAELPAYGLTGERQPDACIEVIPLHYPEDKDTGPLTVPYAAAQGEHGFDPNREDMAAILVTSVPGASITTLADVLKLVLP